MIFETSQIGKSGEETYQTKIDAELAMKDVKELYKEEEFYITIKGVSPTFRKFCTVSR